MSESFAFELKLIDSVTANARRAAAAVSGVESAANKARRALDFSQQHKRVEGQIKQLTGDPKGYVALIRAQKELRDQRNRLLEDAGIKRPESFAAGLMSRFSFAKIAGAAAVGELVAGGALVVADALVEGAKAAVDVISEGVKDAFKSAAGEEKQRISERYALGVQGGADFRNDANRFATRTGFDDSGVRRLMIPLRNAGVSQEASRQAFATANDIAVTKGQGGNEQAVAGIIEQFQKIYTKKGIGKRQLVELLGNVGTTIPDFYKELGKKMGISAKDAEKKAEEGGLDPQLLVNMITTAQNKKQGGAAGTAGEGFSKSLEDRWRRLVELPGEFYKNLVDSPGFTRASEMLGSLLEKLDPNGPAGQRIQASIDDMFEKITGVIGNPSEAAESLADHIEEAIHFTGELVSDFRDLYDALVPSLDTLEDMVIAMRQVKAYASMNQMDLMAAQMDRARIDQRRIDRAAEKEVRSATPQLAAGNLMTSLARGNLDAAIAGGGSPLLNPLAFGSVLNNAQLRTVDNQNDIRKAAGSSKVVHITVAPGAVVVHGADADSARKVGDHIHREATNALERAAQEQS